jgi:putative peptidoglycan lipid II flippase
MFRNQKQLQHIISVSFLILISRILGLIRDTTIFIILGTNILNSAFILAFTLPNLFRRLIGEGALTAAFLPIFSEKLEKIGRKAAFKLFNQVLSHLFIWITIITLVGMIIIYITFFVIFQSISEKWIISSKLSIVLLPYTILVCCSSLFSVVLNALHCFMLPALTTFWLNLSIIFFLILGTNRKISLTNNFESLSYFLCMGVIVGGFIQIIIPTYSLWKKGWRPKFDIKFNSDLSRILKLFFPNFLNNAVFQLNFLISRLLAYSINSGAVSLLYIINRLIDIPIGIFTISIVTVIFPYLTKFAAKNDYNNFIKSYHYGLKLIFLITIPITIGSVIIGNSILNLLFSFKSLYQFRESSIVKTMLSILLLILPLYSLSIISINGLYSLKNTNTPFKIGLYGFIVSIIVSLLLIYFYGILGLSIGNIIFVIFQSLFLYYNLTKKFIYLKFFNLSNFLLKIIFSSLISGFFIMGSFNLIINNFLSFNDKKITFSILILISLTISFISYYFLLMCTRVEERKIFKEGIISNFFLKKVRKKLK